MAVLKNRFDVYGCFGDKMDSLRVCSYKETRDTLMLEYDISESDYYSTGIENLEEFVSSILLEQKYDKFIIRRFDEGQDWQTQEKYGKVVLRTLHIVKELANWELSGSWDGEERGYTIKVFYNTQAMIIKGE